MPDPEALHGKAAFRPARLTWVLLTAMACAAMLLSLLVKESNRVTQGDVRASLLVSQELIHHGTVRLDRYGAEKLKPYGFVIQEKNGHFYYDFPLGTSLLSAPFVAVANTLGFDMLDSELAVQQLLTALISAAVLVLLYFLARVFLAPPLALALTALCVFGTSLASTAMAGLWSHDFAVLLATLAIFLSVRAVFHERPLQPFALAACLFLAYLCRPTLAVLAPCLLLYLFFYRKADALKGGAWLGALLVCFSLWSEHEFHQSLPDYYLPKRLEGGEFWTALFQNTLGPSRGLFVFSPFLAVAIPLAATQWRQRRRYAPALLVGLAWPLLHLLAISRFPHWWAGFSYGPRLMTDCLPGLFVLLFFSLREAAGWRRRVALILIAMLGVFSIYVNSWQALFNPWTSRWNVEPNVDQYPEYLADWRYPQFLHGAKRHRERVEEFNRILVLSNDEPGARFPAWSEPASGLRWAGGNHASIDFPIEHVWTLQSRLRIEGFVASRQRLAIRLNGTSIHDGFVSAGRLHIDLDFASQLFVEGDNTLQFELDTRPADADPAAAGHTFAFKALSIFLKQ